MNKQQVASKTLGQEYSVIHHPCGLTLLLCPMDGYSTAYALFAAKVGSVDTTFKTQQDSDFVTVPPGIAHFLEHKMFECEDGDAFAKYAKTGASANAFTSFDRTAYLFSCSDNFKESLEILLDFVSKPYFTPETVAKEQGIIGQEIRMYDDSPDWRAMVGLLEALYQKNPVRLDIAGTVESIAQIDADLLYRCHRTFYNLHNMVLAVAGNFQPQTVLELVERILPKAEEIQIQRQSVEEPREVNTSLVRRSLSVSIPQFQIGFKGLPGDERQNLLHQVQNEVLMEMVCGESSPLYRRMYDSGLINSAFDYEVLGGRDYLACLYGGESRDPEEVYRQLKAEIQRLRREGLDGAAFARCRKAAYGRYIGMYSRVEAVASLMVLSHFSGLGNMYHILEQLRNLTLEDLQKRLEEDFDPRYSAISIIDPVA